VGLDVLAPQNGSPAPGTIKVASAVETAASVENRRLPPIPSPEPAAAQPTAPEAGLPDFAKKADDLESIRGAVDDAAAVGGALWFSYLFGLFYLAVAAGAVTHADLFLENPVKLPFLNIDLPLLAFFSLAPILFLFAHGYTLMHLVMLTEKAKDYDQALREQIGADNPASDKLRRQLPSNIFIQYLAGAANLRKSAFGFVAWTTLAVAPVLLVLMMQLQFLPFHSLFIAWTQRIVVLDLALIWCLWGTIRSGRETGGDRGALFWAGRILSLATGLALTIGVILFSAAVATFPGEWQEDHLPSAEILPQVEPASGPNNPSQQQRNGSLWDWARMSWDWVNRSEKVSLHDWIFNSPLDGITRHRLLPFANTLVLIGFNVLEGLHLDDPKKEGWRDFVFRARGRDLVGANFDFASLPRVDFTGAHLENASLHAAQLDRVSFDRAHLQDASLDGAHLQGASLDGAELQDRHLIARIFRARRSLTRGFRARRSITHSFRARRSLMRGFRARRSMTRGFRARRSFTRSSRARRSLMRSFRARRSLTRSFWARRSLMRSFWARRSLMRSFRGGHLRPRIWTRPIFGARSSGVRMAASEAERIWHWPARSGDPSGSISRIYMSVFKNGVKRPTRTSARRSRLFPQANCAMGLLCELAASIAPIPTRRSRPATRPRHFRRRGSLASRRPRATRTIAKRLSGRSSRSSAPVMTTAFLCCAAFHETLPAQPAAASLLPASKRRR
jgi:hypothetical protein